VVRSFAALAFAALSAFSLAQAPAPPEPAKALYKLVDKSGKVIYVDQVPKGFDGEVTRIEVDAAPTLQRPAPPGGPATPPPTQEKAGLPDTNAARKARRERLQADVDRAWEKLAAAQKALADGGDPKEGEYQPIQQKFDAAGSREGDAGPRPNCRRQVDAYGQPYWMCPTIVPGEKYRERRAELQEAVRLAEEELETAQRAYRRGVD
jgi:hypothetical protein